jgi:hypothetical protein
MLGIHLTVKKMFMLSRHLRSNIIPGVFSLCAERIILAHGSTRAIYLQLHSTKMLCK